MQHTVLKQFDSKNKLAKSFHPLFLSVAAIAFLLGCAQTISPKAFNKILPGKSLLHCSNFELISDFNSEPLKNHYQKEWVAKVSDGAKVLLTPIPQDSLNSFGGSLGVVYEIPKTGFVRVASELDGLDISQAKFVVGKVEAASWKKFGGKVFIELSDSNGNSKKVEINPFSAEGSSNPNHDWLDIEIPIGLFQGVNLDVLDKFSFNLEAEAAPVSGTLIFDEFAFYGAKNLFNTTAMDPKIVRQVRANTVASTIIAVARLAVVSGKNLFPFGNNFSVGIVNQGIFINYRGWLRSLKCFFSSFRLGYLIVIFLDG